VPTVVVFIECIAQFVTITDEIGSDLLDETDQTGTSRPSVEPESEGGGISIHFCLNEYVVYLPARLIGIEVTRVEGDIGHALNSNRDTIAEGTRSSLGRDTPSDSVASSSNDPIIYLSIYNINTILIIYTNPLLLD